MFYTLNELNCMLFHIFIIFLNFLFKTSLAYNFYVYLENSSPNMENKTIFTIINFPKKRNLYIEASSIFFKVNDNEAFSPIKRKRTYPFLFGAKTCPVADICLRG